MWWRLLRCTTAPCRHSPCSSISVQLELPARKTYRSFFLSGHQVRKGIWAFREMKACQESQEKWGSWGWMEGLACLVNLGKRASLGLVGKAGRGRGENRVTLAPQEDPRERQDGLVYQEGRGRKGTMGCQGVRDQRALKDKKVTRFLGFLELRVIMGHLANEEKKDWMDYPDYQGKRDTRGFLDCALQTADIE